MYKRELFLFLFSYCLTFNNSALKKIYKNFIGELFEKNIFNTKNTEILFPVFFLYLFYFFFQLLFCFISCSSILVILSSILFIPSVRVFIFSFLNFSAKILSFSQSVLSTFFSKSERIYL